MKILLNDPPNLARESTFKTPVFTQSSRYAAISACRSDETPRDKIWWSARCPSSRGYACVMEVTVARFNGPGGVSHALLGLPAAAAVTAVLGRRRRSPSPPPPRPPPPPPPLRRRRRRLRLLFFCLRTFLFLICRLARRAPPGSSTPAPACAPPAPSTRTRSVLPCRRDA